MRIGLIIDRFGAGHGGAERYLRELAQWLGAHGDEPLLFSGDEAVGFPARAIRVDPGALPRGLRERRFAKRVLETTRREGCDATLSIRPVPGVDFFQPHGGAMQDAWRGRGESKRGLRGAFWRAGRLLDLKFALLRQLENETLARAKKVLPVSESSAQSWRAHFPQSSSKILALPLGVDFERFSAGEGGTLLRGKGAAPGMRVVLFVAQDYELKGLRPALETIRLLRAQGCDLRLFVLGEDSHRARWRHLVERLGLGEVVFFLGLCDDPAVYYRAADVLLHPTFFDPCARVVLEALACGLPVVTTQRNGAFVPGSRGIEAVENPRDASALAIACLRMLGLPRMKDRFGYLSADRAASEHFAALREAIEAETGRR